jgi:hypothetical protein
MIKIHNRGGYRANAGRKSGWSTTETKTIRVPESLAEQILEVAHRLDSGESLESETKSNIDLEQLESIKQDLLKDQILTRKNKDRSVVKRGIEAFIEKLVGQEADQPVQINLLDIDTKSNSSPKQINK